MNNGKTLFAQLMDFLPWSTFTRIVARYRGDQRVRTLSCAEHYRAMAFAQLTYRESLRDIESCLSVQTSKLYSMGFRDPVRRSTLADANEARDWRIYAELAQRLIGQARRLYVNEDLGFDLANTVYALDSTTIDLCLAVFPWAHFRTTKACPWRKQGAAVSISPGSMCCISPELSSSPVPNRTGMPIGSIRPRQTVPPVSSAIRPSPPASAGASSGWSLHQPALPRTPKAHPLEGHRNEENAGVPHQPVRVAGRDHLRALQKPLAS
jgi:hypothetical protein